MQLLAAVAFLLLICLSVARPQWKENDYDYRLYEDDASGVVIDRAQPKSHHHHGHSHHNHHHSHHKDYLKTNRVGGASRFFDDFRL